MFGRILIIYFLTFTGNSFSEECRSSNYKTAADKAADDWLGLKCDPLNKETWQPEWTSPCDCLNKGDKFSRIKDAIFKKNRENREEIIVDLLEKKVADVIESQIDSGFEQALRLDAMLKQGVFLEDSKIVRESFPESCRINKVKDVISKHKDIRECDQKTYHRRLKALLGDHKTVDDFVKSKMKTLKNATLNQLSPEDKSKGLCLPYKSFQSLNNSNPLRKTYLKIAALKGNFTDFQNWAEDRKTPEDTHMLIGKSIAEKSFKESRRSKLNFEVPVAPSAPRNGGKRIGGLVVGHGISEILRLTENGLEKSFEIEKDLDSGIESINRDQIQHLLKTDPVFERMTKDPAFFNKVARGELGDPDNFLETDKKVVSALMESQNKQCKSLYGESDNVIVGAVTGTSDRGQRKSQGVKQESSKNLLTQYLCDENFPRKFLNKENIQNFLAPEFKKKADLNGTKHTEAIITKWGYCRGDNYKIGDDGAFEIDFELKSVPDAALEAQPLTKLLNLSLNPESDLMSSKNNLYTSFNKEICPHMDKECINPDPSFINFKCATSQIATDVSAKIISSKLSGEEAQRLISDFSKDQISDKKFKDSLTVSGKFSEDQISAIITLRNQTPNAKYARAVSDLKAALGIPKEQDINEYFDKNGGIDAVLSGEKVSGDIRNRITGFKTGYRSDNIHGETTSAQNSSYFANYFALGESSDEGKIATYKKDPKPDVSTGGTSQGSVRIGSTPGQQSSTPVGQTGEVSSPSANTGTFYQRRDFDSSTSVNQPVQVKKIDPPPQEGNKELASTPKEEAPRTVKTIKEDVVTSEIPADGSSGKTSGNLGSGIVLTNNSNGRSLGDTVDNSSALERQKRDLENRINRLNDEINNFDNGRGDLGHSENPELDDLKKRLKELIDERKNGGRGFSGGGKYTNNDNNSGRSWNGGFGNDFNSNWSNNDSKNYNTPPFNNGYGRGEEFVNEQAKNKLDDGGEEFDPENTKKNATASGSVGSASAGKTKGASGGGVSLSSNGGDDESGSGGGRTKGRRKKGQGGAEADDQEIIGKCGTGAILKCIFPNSYFVDDEVKGRLYVTIANLKLEGRKFQTLEKVRKSKKEMRMGESNKAKYFLYTYDVVLDSEKREVTNDEREELYKEIKENRKNPTFKKKLIKIRYMTKVVPPKILLNDKEALEIINRTITPEEYEELELLND